MESDIWTKRYATAELTEPVAVVGSPGLRSIGKLTVDSLIAQTGAQLSAEIYSTHLPSIYQTTPSYAAHPSLPGMGGAIVEAGNMDLPKVQFFGCANPALILVRGYHPNFAGQFTVAEKVVDLLSEMQVRKMYVVAGYGSKETKICCAANSKKAIDEMKEKFDIGIGYKGPFMGFSGLVFGLSKLRNIESVCLFAGTEPKEDDLEFPDKQASDRVVDLLNRILGLKAQSEPEKQFESSGNLR
jgi:proteasome assembly chaperone (PAC2) family protein